MPDLTIRSPREHSVSAPAPRLTLRRFLGRLVDPHATGWRVWLVSYALFLLDDLPFFWADRAEGWPGIDALATAYLLTTVAHLALVLVLLLARLTWLRLPSAARWPAVTVWTFIVGSVVSSVVESIAGALAASEAMLLSLDGLVYRTVALVVIAVAVATLAEQRRALEVLMRRRAELEHWRAQGEATVTRLRFEVLDLVREQIATLGAQVDLASEVIRRISHDLASTEPELGPGLPAGHSSPTFRAVWRAVALRPLFAPGLMATVMMILAVRSTTLPASDAAAVQNGAIDGLAVTVDVASLGRALLMIAAVWAATYAATRLATRLLVAAAGRSTTSLSWWQHALAVAGAALLAQALAALVYLVPGYSVPPPFEPWMLGTYLGPLMACAIVIGLVRAVDRHAALTRDAVDAVVARLQWDVARLHAMARSERRSIAFLLHGTVVPSLRAAAARNPADSNAERSVMLMVDGVIAALRAGDLGRMRTLADRLDDLVLLWKSVSEIVLDTEESVHLATAGDPVTTSAVSDVVSEAVTNSITHARASRIVVRLRLVDADLIEIVVDEVVASASVDVPTRPSAPGLGTRLFDEVCVLWHRYPHENGSRFHAWVPVGASPDRGVPARP